MTNQDTRSQHRIRAEKYAADRGTTLGRFLGFGNDGDVWETTRGSVVKIEEREASFDRELSCYERLRDRGVANLNGFAVPQLLDSDRSLHAIEMTFVFPPCIIDFAKSYVDQPPDFTVDTLQDWEHETQELFDERWPEVRRLLASLRLIGIFYFDAKPANIRFPD